MTVQELAEKLQRFSSDAEVQILGEEFDWTTQFVIYSRGLNIVRMEPR